METILLTLLLLSVLYLIFAQRHTESDVSDILHRIDFLNKTCQEQEKRINELERNLATVKTNIKRRKSTNRYRRLLEITISKCVVYCNNGWSVSKTLLTKAQSKAYRIFERGVRPSYIRAKRKVHSFVYRAKERQEVLSFKRAKAIHTERFR